MKSHRLYPHIEYLSLFIMLVFTSCNDDIIIEDLQPNGNQLTVLAIIRNHEPLTAIVSNTLSFNNDNVDYRVDNATVLLYEDDSLIYTITEPTAIRPNVVGEVLRASTYLSPRGITMVDGKSYSVKVKAPGFVEAMSETVIFEKTIGSDHSVKVSPLEIEGTFYSFSDTITFAIPEQMSGEITLDNFTWFIEDFDEFSQTQWYRSPYSVRGGRRIYGVDLPAGVYVAERGPIRGFSEFIPPDSILRCGHITHRSPHYLAFATKFTAQDREEVANPQNNGQPVPSNITNGFGYFTVIDSEFACSE